MEFLKKNTPELALHWWTHGCKYEGLWKTLWKTL